MRCMTAPSPAVPQRPAQPQPAGLLGLAEAKSAALLLLRHPDLSAQMPLTQPEWAAQERLARAGLSAQLRQLQTRIEAWAAGPQQQLRPRVLWQMQLSQTILLLRRAALLSRMRQGQSAMSS